MKVVVITGSTRGIGNGLADAFLALGCAVVVSGRSPDVVEQAVSELAAKHETDKVFGHPCDVTDYGQVQGLWDSALAHFGKVDIWINNAGVGHSVANVWDMVPEVFDAVIQTNVIGAMYGAQVALTGMLAQGFGSLYNMEGLGSDGRQQAGLAIYGCSKAGLAYFTDSLIAETKETPIIVGGLRPGMVVTDFVVIRFKERPQSWERAKGFMNILCDRVETVTPWLAKKILANTRTGVRFTWLTRSKLMLRMLAAPFKKRDVFGDCLP